MVDKLFVATKALIENEEGKILILKESSNYEDGSNSDKWDVVGGRIEKGQNFKESLLREIREEAGIEVEIKEPFFVDEWRPKVKEENWQIIGIYFKCTTKSNNIKLSDDHSEFKWINSKEFNNYNLIGNLKKVFEEYNLRK
jgi:8-oxo-dGTP diphosphatase